ncbi:MAG: DNA repair ATPase [Blastocatellia bacterium]|nr:DNA repair ATPase [Blastocatellia bacterium]
MVTRLDHSTFEVIRDRLRVSGETLAARTTALNEERKRLFGGIECLLLTTERIRTEQNCIPCDVAWVDNRLVVGFQVFFGLKREVAVADVFSLFGCEKTETGLGLVPIGPESSQYFLRDEAFLRDFDEVFRYFRNARPIQVRLVEGKLLLVFQTGADFRDSKVLRWAVGMDGTISYMDNRGERDHLWPASCDFEWTPTSPDNQVLGRHSHISVCDEMFVETIGGDLTIKLENNTEDGLGAYREPVEDPFQSLDDAQVFYTRLAGLILLKILPYGEKNWRYLVFNRRTKTVQRIDQLGQGCLRLPEQQGILFPGGYCLNDGTCRIFADAQGLELLRIVRAPNGEDVLYAFRNRSLNQVLLLPYNVIRKEVAPVLTGKGVALAADGTLFLVKPETDEPARVHPIQVWQTPFVSDTHAAAGLKTGSFLETIGNAELVRGLADLLALERLAVLPEPSGQDFETISRAANRLLDRYHWLGHEAVGNLREPITTIGKTAETALREFEKTEALRKAAAESVAAVEKRLEEIEQEFSRTTATELGVFLEMLGKLRSEQGTCISLREVRFADLARLAELEARCCTEFDRIGAETVLFLQTPAAFAPLQRQVEAVQGKLARISSAFEATTLTTELESIRQQLTGLTETLNTLTVADARVRTSILSEISVVLGQLNLVRAQLETRRQELVRAESAVEFAAQLGLLAQTGAGALQLATTPESCDSQLASLLLRLEEVETRFADCPEYVVQLTEQRLDMTRTFSQKRQYLLEERVRLAEQTRQTADRLLQNLAHRAGQLPSPEALNTLFAADPTLLKIRELGRKLRDLQHEIAADDLEAQLKARREEAFRTLRDRHELYDDNHRLIRFGRHRFAVNVQSAELVLTCRDEVLGLHLTGTEFFQPVEVDFKPADRATWEQRLISENEAVYRAEYLAFQVFSEIVSHRLCGEEKQDHQTLLELVRKTAEVRSGEGYEHGVHDEDAARLVHALLKLHGSVGLLRFAPKARAAALLFWAFAVDEKARHRMRSQVQKLATLRTCFPKQNAVEQFCRELGVEIETFFKQLHRRDSEEAQSFAECLSAAFYLFEELAQDSPEFVQSLECAELLKALRLHLAKQGQRLSFEVASEQVQTDLPTALTLARAWIDGFVAATGQRQTYGHVAAEATGWLLVETLLPQRTETASTMVRVESLAGNHPRIEGGTLNLRLDEFLERLQAFEAVAVPRFRHFQEMRSRLLSEARTTLNPAGLKPNVMGAFVRNQLIQQVYLPFIGDNLAKQIGAAGEARRADLMGLLLLISPPGYGKTTLLEYVADRLGLLFVKINGPALGAHVTTLDPAAAPHATARREVEKINFALELGTNCMLYVDDIQHTSAEFLQQFLSLCDAQRTLDGVWQGRAKRYDLRGKRFAVVMAGNPYTESGERFRIPDMLANRADVFNLGDMVAGKEDLFAFSYLENALTSNPFLRPLTTRDPQDLPLLVRMAKGEPVAADQLKHPYLPGELADITAVLQKLLTVQEVVMKVNRGYIESASQTAAFRTEPAFKLQGSYRNMNKIAEKIAPVMDERELQAVIDVHYTSEAQTLTTEAEQNLLKLAEIRQRMDNVQRSRWNEIKHTFQRQQLVGGTENDPISRVVGHLNLIVSGLAGIEAALANSIQIKNS